MISFRWLGERAEPPRRPIKVTGVNYNTSDSSAMAPYPLGGGVNHDVGTMFDRSDDVASLRGKLD